MHHIMCVIIVYNIHGGGTKTGVCGCVAIVIVIHTHILHVLAI